MQIHENSLRKEQFICEVNKSRINIQKFSEYRRNIIFSSLPQIFKADGRQR